MSTRVKTNGSKQHASYEQRSAERWTARRPDWVRTLAVELDAEVGRSGNMRTLGARIGLSASQIAHIIGKTYPGKLDKLEAIVRGALMHAVVQCPVEGEIGRDRCATNQASTRSSCNPMRMQLANACRTCPNAIKKEKS